MALILSPLLFAAVPPLVDYPNYLARMAILAAPEASLNYVVHWRPIPNLAMDLIVPPLAPIFGLETAGRLFIALTLVQLVSGTALLHRALYGRIGWWPLTSVLFLYNIAFYFGFLNYLFGLGAALLTFAGWVICRNWPAWVRLASFSALASLVFILHLFAFGIYGLLIGSYELGLLVAGRSFSRLAIGRFVAIFVQFVPALALWLANAAAGGSHATKYGGLGEKLAAIVAPLNFNDSGVLAAPLVATGCVLAWWRGGLLVAPAMRWPILTAIAAAVAMPSLLYGSFGADIRLPVALPFILIASTRPKFTDHRVAGLAAVAAAILLAVRVEAVAEIWHTTDGRYNEYRAAIRDLPRGARLIVAHAPQSDSDVIRDGYFLLPSDLVYYRHMSELAIMDRDAFVPYFPLLLAPVAPAERNAGRFQRYGISVPWDKLATESALRPAMQPIGAGQWNPYWLGWPEKFEYLLILDFGNPQPSLPSCLALWHRGSFFTLYRIMPGSVDAG